MKRFTHPGRVWLALLPLLAAGCAREQALLPKEPAAAVAAGWENYRSSEYDRAVKLFEAAAMSAPTGSEERAQALFGLATAWNLRRPGEDRKKAQAYYEQVVEEGSESAAGPWAALGLARLQHLVPVGEEPDYTVVRSGYQRVIDRYPGHLAAQEAFIYKMSTFIATLKEDETRYALAGLQKFVKTPGQKAFLQPAWSLMAVGYTTLKEPEQRLYAEIMALRTTEVDPTNPFTEFAWAYWNIATIAEFDVGDFDLARSYYRRLLNEYPRDIRVFGAREALQRMDRVEAGLRAEAGSAPATNAPAAPAPARRART